MKTLRICLIGFGAIGHSLALRLQNEQRLRITYVVSSAAGLMRTQAAVSAAFDANLAGIPSVLDQIPREGIDLILECAGHSAITAHVLPALARGQACAILSVGALSNPGLVEKLEAAATKGKTQLHLLPGAIGGIDAIAAAKTAGLELVRYTGRKPPLAWMGTPAEESHNLTSIAQSHEAVVLLEASAREAAHLFPKNANVAATIALAGIGLDNTRVRLLADPNTRENIHEIEMEGAFGAMRLQMRGNPLPENPKTSMLTVLSVMRFLHNLVNPITI